MNFFFISTAQQILFRFDDTIQNCFAYLKKKEVFVKEIYHGIDTILWSTEYTPWFGSV